MVVPRLDAAEPLGLELSDFAASIHTGDAPRSDAPLGAAIVRVLEAAHMSMASSGAPVLLGAATHTAALQRSTNGTGNGRHAVGA